MQKRISKFDKLSVADHVLMHFEIAVLQND